MNGDAVLRLVGGPRDGQVLATSLVSGDRPAFLLGEPRRPQLLDQVEGNLRWVERTAWYERDRAA